MRADDEAGDDSIVASKQVLSISFTWLMQRAAALRRERGGRPVGVGGAAWHSPLVPIRVTNGTGRPPLFLMHPVGGSVMAYFRLARSLHADQPIYAIENQVAFTSSARSFSSIESMAGAYLGLTEHCRNGPPCVLGGYSMGGMVAFEMARQLSAQGTPAALVAIIDTPAAVAPVRGGAGSDSLTAQDVVTMGAIITGPLGVDLRLDLQELEAASPAGRIDYLIAALRARRILPPEIDIGLFHKLVAAVKTNDLAQRRYRPQCYAGEVCLFRAAERSPLLAEEAGPVYDELAFGWQQFCAKPVRVTAVPGSHLRLMDQPYVHHLGSSLQHAIDQTAHRTDDESTVPVSRR